MSDLYELPEEDMTVDIELLDGRVIEFQVITVFEVNKKDYIALLPMVDEDDDLYGNYWLYRLKENINDTNEEPELIEITDDDELEAVEDAFDEYLDNQEFDEIIED